MAKNLICLALTMACSTLPLHAEAPTPANAGRYELSPDIGFMGGSAMLGLRAAMNYHPVTFELGATQVIGSVATLYPVTMSLILDLARVSTVVPYATVGGGLFLTVPMNAVGDETISSVGASFGGGMKYYVTSRVGLRFEVRQLFTKVDNRLDGREDILIFQSSSLGVIFAFG